MDKLRFDLQFFAKGEETEFNIDDIPDDDSSDLFGDSDDDDEDPDDDDSGKSSHGTVKTKKAARDDDEEEEEEEDDFSDLGLEDDDDDEADDKSKTSKVPDKFKEKTLKDVVKSYSNAEKEIGRLRNELAELKKAPPKKEDKPAEKEAAPEKIDLAKVIDIVKLNEAILSGTNPAEEVIKVIAQSFNALQDGAVKTITKILSEKDQEYRDNYFNEIDHSRAEKEAAEPFLQEAARLSKKYKDWQDIKPYMQQAIESNPDLVVKPDDYEQLYKRVKAYLKSKGKLDQNKDQSLRQKKSGGSFVSGRKGGEKITKEDETAILDSLFKDEYARIVTPREKKRG